MNWQIIGGSALGASHKRRGQPNQDAWAYAQGENYACIAVADGHGSAKHFLSDVGARLAVHVTINLLEEFAAQSLDMRETRQAADYLPRALVQAWRQAVDEADADNTDAANRYSVYGTTLLAALVTSRYALYLQLGDGDLVIANPDGTLLRPLPKNAGLIANETYSLCEENAVNRIELSLKFFDCSPKPCFVFLATDGYANSFASEADFLQAVKEFLAQCGLYGAKQVQDCLADWLAETSEQGSGDDVTVAIFADELLRPFNSTASD